MLSAHSLRVLRFSNDSIQNNLSSVLKDILTVAKPQ